MPKCASSMLCVESIGRWQLYDPMMSYFAFFNSRQAQQRKEAVQGRHLNVSTSNYMNPSCVLEASISNGSFLSNSLDEGLGNSPELLLFNVTNYISTVLFLQFSFEGFLIFIECNVVLFCFFRLLP